jgi:glycosyltransferase involved in cell wall biosynthesis
MKLEIKVSVCVVTYNQEKYIAQCLQSLVDQEAEFTFEIIVADDCSTDGTCAIVQEFVDKYPAIVKPIFHANNIGAYKNFIFVHQQATGEYIAHMDGDDYALPGKLQAQADYLDKNQNCNILWHPMVIEMLGGSVKAPSKAQSEFYSRRFYRGDIIKLMAIGSNSSKMYRKEIREFNDPHFDVMDYFANVEQVGNGYAAFPSDVPLGVHRAGIGIASSGPKTREILAECFLYFSHKYPEFKLQANTAALTYLLIDCKNFRATTWLFLKVFVRTFHPFSVFEFLKNLKTIRIMKG